MVRTVPPLKAKAKGSSGVVKKTKVTKHVVTLNKKKKYKFKKQEEEEFVEPIPDGWPVASTRPQKEYSLAMELSKNDNEKEDDDDDDDEESKPCAGLRPGKALQSCSGTDVQLSRGASARPNLTKGKGRFLIILPGNMSLTPQTAVAASAVFTPAKTNDSEFKNDSPQPTPIPTPSSDPMLIDAATATPSNNNLSSTAANLPRLGKIEKLGSDNPILRVPFPDGDGRELIFRGRKISTSSRFMSLTCKGGKGAVNCKDVFSSVIVFGEAGWEDNGFARETEDISSDDISIRHYGGSTRTVDGGKGGSTKKQKAWSTTPKATRTIITQDTSSPIEESEDEEELDLPDDDDDDDDEAFFVNTKTSGLSQESASRRTTSRSSVRSKVNYADTLEMEEVEEETSDENNSVKDQDGPKMIQKNKKTPKVSTSTNSKNKAGKAKKTVDSLVLSSDEEDEAVDVAENIDSGDDEILSKTPVFAKRTPRRSASQAKKKYIEKLDSSSDEEHNDEDDSVSKESAVDGEDASSEEETTKKSTKQLSTKKTVTKQSKSSLPRSKSSIAKSRSKVNYADTLETEEVEEETTDENNSVKDQDGPKMIQKNKKTPKVNTNSKNKAGRAKKTVDTLVLSSDEEDEAVDVTEKTDSGDDEILSKTPVFAKRTPRRSASQAKKKCIEKLDSSSDEEHNDEDDSVSKESAVAGEDASSEEETTKKNKKRVSTKKTVTMQSKSSRQNTSSEPMSANRKRSRSTEKTKVVKKVETAKTDTGRGKFNSTSKESKTIEKEDTTQSLIPSSPIISPRRRRHKSPAKKSSSSPSKSADGNSRKRRLVCDLTNDDEFNFTN